MKILIDQEINLSELDLLHTKTYADTLSQLIATSPSDKPFTIGLFGEWGSGKSSIVKTLSEELQADKKSTTKFVVYDAWKYSNDSFRRTFLLKMQQELGLAKTEKMESFYSSKSTDIEIIKTPNKQYIALLLIVLLISLGLYSSFEWRPRVTMSIALIISIISLGNSFLSKFFNELKISRQNPYLFAPEQFEECFKEIVTKAMSKSSRLKLLPNFIKAKSDGDIEKLVIVIDNIDRCPKDTAYDLLTNTKNFIDAKLNIIFLIPVDDRALKRHIFKGDQERGQEGEEFLRKFFNVTVRIKPYKLSEIFYFASAINAHHALGLSPDTINIVAKEYASNPRRIIQFFNNLQVELLFMAEKYGKDFTLKYEMAICKFLIIREEWPLQYQKLCNRPEIFFKVKSINDDNLVDISKTKDEIDYESFLNVTKVTIKDLDYATLERILVNRDAYAVLPESIKELIVSNKLEQLEETGLKLGIGVGDMLNSLLFSLKSARRNELMSTEVPLILDYLYAVFLAFPEINTSFYTRLEMELGIGRLIEHELSFTHSIERMIDFLNLAYKRGHQFMDQALVKYFVGFSHHPDKFYDTGQFEIYEYYIKNAVKTQLEVAKPGFRNYLNAAKESEKVVRFLKPFQMDVLYDYDIIFEYLIPRQGRIWERHEEIEDWKYLASHTTDQTSLINSLILSGNANRIDLLANREGWVRLMNILLSLCKVVNLNSGSVEIFDSLNHDIFKKKRNRSRNGILISEQYLQNLSKSDIEANAYYLLRAFRFTNFGQTSAEWLGEFVSLYGIDSILPEITTLIEGLEDPLNAKSFLPIMLKIPEYNFKTNELLASLMYLEVGKMAVFNNKEKMALIKPLLLSEGRKEEGGELLMRHMEIKAGRTSILDIIRDLDDQELSSIGTKVMELIMNSGANFNLSDPE